MKDQLTTTSSLKNIRFVRYGDLVLINESSLAKLDLDVGALSTVKFDE